MRARLALLLAVGAALAAAAPATAGVSPAARPTFARLARQLPGSEGIAVTAGGTTLHLGTLHGGTAWSTAKVPVAMAAVAAKKGTSTDLERAITASDNAAAERLFAALGPPATAARRATAQLRAGDDARTVVQSRRTAGTAYSAFGQTAWRLDDQARFALALPCSAAGRRVLGLMRRVVRAQRWGLGTLGAPAAFKAGWGPGAIPGRVGRGWLDRQFGTVVVGGRTLGVALASTAPGHAAGTRAVSRLAAWVAAHASAVDAGPAPCHARVP